MKFMIALFVLFSMSCKQRSSRLSEQLSNTDSADCSEASIEKWIQELSNIEPELITAQRYSRNIAQPGNCTVNKTLCEQKCDSDFWGVMKLWYKDQFEFCMDLCGDNHARCMKLNSQQQPNAEQPQIDIHEALAKRQELVRRREDILKALHRCTTNSKEQVARAQKYEQIGDRKEEWRTLRERWKQYLDRDPLIPAAFRFVGSTFVDVPARKSDQSLAEWKKSYEADHVQHRIGLAVGDVALTGLDLMVSSRKYVMLSGLPDHHFQSNFQNLDYLAAPGMFISQIANSCAEASDLCTAISCMGHRTQEILSLRDNLENMQSLEKTEDGRDFALCRHYAPTFKLACNLWAKRTNQQDKIECGNSLQISLFHAWPTIKIKSGQKTYEYIYDLLNDPFTPDLIPVNGPARNAPEIPCNL